MLKRYRESATVLAGGTDVVVRLRQGLVTPAVVLGIAELNELKGIASGSRGLRLGSASTLHQLAMHREIVHTYSALAEAANSVGAPYHRRMGTLGGNLCLETRCWHYNRSWEWRGYRAPCLKAGGGVCYVAKGGASCHAYFSGDVAPALLVLEGEVVLRSAEATRTMPLGAFYTGDGQKPNVLEPNELLVEVNLPSLPTGTGSAYRKARIRQDIDFPLAGAAALLTVDKWGLCQKARLAFTALDSAPRRVPEAEALLEGTKLTEESLGQAAKVTASSARPYRNAPGGVAYRRQVLEAVTRQALAAAWRRARESLAAQDGVVSGP